MTGAKALFADLLVAKVEIRVSRGMLILKAKPGVLTPEMKRALIKYKAELVSMLEEGRGVSWAEWQAAMLNSNFRHHGVSGDRCRYSFTAEDVKAGERARSSGEHVNGSITCGRKVINDNPMDIFMESAKSCLQAAKT